MNHFLISEVTYYKIQEINGVRLNKKVLKVQLILSKYHK